MSGWRKCDTCRKVRPLEEFDGGSPTCRSCLTAPAAKRRTAAAPVTTRTTPPTAAAAPAKAATRRASPLGAVGMGDLEVRERRAKRAAWEALATAHPEEFALLLRDARQAEGLRTQPAQASGAGAADAGPAAEEG